MSITVDVNSRQALAAEVRSPSCMSIMLVRVGIKQQDIMGFPHSNSVNCRWSGRIGLFILIDVVTVSTLRFALWSEY